MNIHVTALSSSAKILASLPLGSSKGPSKVSKIDEKPIMNKIKFSKT